VSGNALSGYGVRVDGSYNVVIRNSAIGTNSYSIGSQNIAGPLVTETGTVTNANPWANFSH
jgi:hypothetical protein